MQGKGLEKTREYRKTWPELKSTFGGMFKEKTRLQWEEVFDGTDACVTPVLELGELENDPSREGDQRPAVTLRDTPSLALRRGSLTRDASEGQGQGFVGDGWTSEHLRPGQGGEETLNQWLGWKRGKDFEVENGGLIGKQNSKL